MTDCEIKYRQASISDKDQILSLFRAAFAESNIKIKQSNFWDWQFINNPEGVPFIGLAEIDNHIIGHYGIIPYEYYTPEGNIIKVGLVIDVMVHPNYQRRGIFVALSKFSLKGAIKSLNIKFTIGYPFTGTTYSSVIPGHTKVGWNMMEKLSFYMLPFNFQKVISFKFPVLKPIAQFISFPARYLFEFKNKLSGIARKKFRKKKGEKLNFSIQTKIKFNNSDISLFQNLLKGRFTKKRDPKFLMWRLCQRPNTQYTIIRIKDSNNKTKAMEILRTAYMEDLKLGVIIDIICPYNLLYDLIEKGNNFLKSKGCDAIVLIEYANSKKKKIISKLGFIDTRERYQIINWKPESDRFKLPHYPKVNFFDFDVF